MKLPSAKCLLTHILEIRVRICKAVAIDAERTRTNDINRKQAHGMSDFQVLTIAVCRN